MNNLKYLFSFAAMGFAVFLTSFCLRNTDEAHSEQGDTIAFSVARNHYENYCSGCHGLNLEKFVSSKWVYGKTEDAVFTTIKEGKSDIGMPGFSATFSDSEIKNLVAYVLKLGNPVAFNSSGMISQPKIHRSEKLTFYVDTVLSGLDVPWGMTWLPNGDMLITERSGKLLLYTTQRKVINIEGVPKVYAYGQGGLLDIELHPNYKQNGWIYLTFSYYAGETLEDGGTTALMRAKLKDNKLVEQQILFKSLPAEKKGVQYGSRIEFDKQNRVYFSVGDRGVENDAQLLSNSSGCVIRLNDDGSIPSDNPFINNKAAVPGIYSYGHRNIQGLNFNPWTGELWSNEHGPKGGDEVNIIKPGKNYGWPVISFGINYDGTILTPDTAKAGMEQPMIYWVPSIAPCGSDFVKGSLYKNWTGNYLVGSLRFKYVARCEIEGNKIVHQEKLLENIGRVRNVIQGPDGYIYVAIEQPGKIVRLVPVN
jgi:aldose sugar dehydrogenase